MELLQSNEPQRPFRSGILIRVLPFAIASAVGLIVPLAGAKFILDIHSPFLIPTFALGALTAVSIVWLRYRRQPLWCDLIPVLLWVLALALLREGTNGNTLPYISLLVLTLFWLGVYHPKEQFALGASAAVASVLFGLVYDQATAVAWADGLERLFIGLAISGVVVLLLEKMQQQRDDLHYLAIADPLTGAANLRSWNTTMRQEMGWSRRKGQTFTLGIIHLTQLAEINRQRGFAAGDALLVAASTAWISELRDRDVLFRLQGSDFVVLLAGAQGDMARLLLDHIHRATPALQCAIGAATWNGHENVIELVERANNALRLAEEGEGDEVVFGGADAGDVAFTRGA